jgi:molecular chaperone HtpG
MGQEMQRVYKMMERDFEAPRKVLEINPKHPTVASLAAKPEGDLLVDALIEQIYENALLIEGLHPDPAGMIPRIEELMKAALN